MQKMKCSVCGHIHESNTAPEKCPVCGVGPENLTILTEEQSWKCTICSYVHKGDNPPEICPVCKVNKDKFILENASLAEEKDENIVPSKEVNMVSEGCFFTRLVRKYHLHSISVHFPNGILPCAISFILLSFFLSELSLDSAAFYCLIFVLINMPLVILSGVVEWRRRYGATKTPVFAIKAACALVVLLGISALVLWRYIQPNVLFSEQGVIFVSVALLILGAAGIAGHLGGSLMFASRK
ncbi:MAG: rubredoxin-type Fe(Cys)4 protein [Desulfotalea sp.]